VGTHWEIYLSRDRISGLTPWAIVEWSKGKISAQYASSVIIKTMSYTGTASRSDRPLFVVHCFGILRRSGNVIYIEPAA
jgi:hypothetical protein